MKSKSKDVPDLAPERSVPLQPSVTAAVSEEIQELRSTNERISKELAMTLERLEDARKESAERDKEVALAADRYKQTLIRIVREQAQQSGRAARDLCMRNTERIGFPQYVRYVGDRLCSPGHFDSDPVKISHCKHRKRQKVLVLQRLVLNCRLPVSSHLLAVLVVTRRS